MPIIQSLAVVGLPAGPGGVVQIQASAQSAGSVALSYAWSVSGSGWSISAGANSANVTISAVSGYSALGIATVIVTDTAGGQATGVVALNTVADPGPTIQSVAVYPQPVYTVANLLLSATHPYATPLTTSWKVGGIENLASGMSASWVSPGIPGLLLVSPTVSDGTVSASASVSMQVSSANPWPKFRRDMQGTGRSTGAIAASTAGTVRWASSAQDTFDSSAAIDADGMIYAGSTASFYGINPDGSTKWTYLTGGSVYSSPATGADGTLYVGSDNGMLHAINSRDGSPKWSQPYQAGGAVQSSPALGADGTIYVGSDDDKLHAVNPDGTGQWTYQTGDLVRSSPAIGSDGTIYVGSVDGKLYALNPDGTLKWAHQTGGPVYSSPAVGVDGTIYVGSLDRKLYAFAPGDGAVKWTCTFAASVGSSPAVATDGTVYVGSSDAKLHAIRPDGSCEKWVYSMSGAAPSSAALGSDGTIYVSAYQWLYAINSGGSLKWSYFSAQPFRSSPAIGADGTLYIGTLLRLFAFR